MVKPMAAPAGGILGGRLDGLVFYIPCECVVEFPLLVVAREANRLYLAFREEGTDCPCLQIGEMDQSFLRASQIERRFMLADGFFDTGHIPVHIAVEELQEKPEVLGISLVRRGRNQRCCRSVGSRTGAALRRFSLSVSPRFLWECLTS